MLQATNEIRTRRIHLRHFINEDNFATIEQRFEVCFQCNKCIEPSFHGANIGALLSYALHKVTQLNA